MNYGHGVLILQRDFPDDFGNVYVPYTEKFMDDFGNLYVEWHLDQINLASRRYFIKGD